MASESIIDSFDAYKDAAYKRLELAGDNDELKIRSLQSFVEELLDQNQTLIQCIHELEKEAKNRALQMEKRLETSAKTTEEAAIGLNKYEKCLKRFFSQKLCELDAADVIDELNNHIAAMKIENEFLRNQNDNLKQDVRSYFGRFATDDGDEVHGDPVVIANACNSLDQGATGFCDEIKTDPGPIFWVDYDEPSPICKSNSVPALTELCRYTPEDRKSILCDTSERHKKLKNCCDSLLSNSITKVCGEKCTQTESTQSIPLLSTKVTSLTLDPLKLPLIIEEKEVLIDKLYEHLQCISNDLQLKDEVVKNLEIKLNRKREENALLCADAKSLKSEAEENKMIIDEFKERIDLLNNQKRSIMIKLDEEYEEHLKSKNELIKLTSQLTQCLTQIENQNITIHHLREAIVSKSKATSTFVPLQVNGSMSSQHSNGSSTQFTSTSLDI